jgi:hypothetical protein
MEKNMAKKKLKLTDERPYFKPFNYPWAFDAFKEKLTIQEKYSKKDFLLFKWRRIKLAIAQKVGKISNG